MGCTEAAGAARDIGKNCLSVARLVAAVADCNYLRVQKAEQMPLRKFGTKVDLVTAGTVRAHMVGAAETAISPNRMKGAPVLAVLAGNTVECFLPIDELIPHHSHLAH